ncbi:unnamed protein product [Gadus morhua 'NCC']
MLDVGLDTAMQSRGYLVVIYRASDGRIHGLGVVHISKRLNERLDNMRRGRSRPSSSSSSVNSPDALARREMERTGKYVNQGQGITANPL